MPDQIVTPAALEDAERAALAVLRSIAAYVSVLSSVGKHGLGAKHPEPPVVAVAMVVPGCDPHQ